MGDYPEIDDANFKGASQTFKQWLVLKIRVRNGISFGSPINVLIKSIFGIRRKLFLSNDDFSTATCSTPENSGVLQIKRVKI